MKLFCNTTFDATKSLITAQANNNLASFPTLYFEDKLPIEIVFVGEGGDLASFVGQAGHLITIAIGNLESRHIITQAILDAENKAVLDIGTAEFFNEMEGLEQKTFIFEIQICFSTGKTRTLCQQNCQVKNQIIGTEITAPTLVRPNPPTEIFAGAYPNPPMNVVPGFSSISIFEINAVNWTNLSEINLSGEKLLNASFEPPHLIINGQEIETITEFNVNLVGREIKSIVTNANRNMVAGEITTITQFNSTGGVLHSGGDGTKEIRMYQQGTGWKLLKENTKSPNQWEVVNGTIDEDYLEQNIIKGHNGAVGIRQMFTTPIQIGTKLIIRATQLGSQTGSVFIQTLNSSGSSFGSNINFNDFIEFAVVEQPMYGLKFSTAHGERQVDNLSLFQGAVSGGTVQANPNGGLQKISGVPGFKAGASSTNFIDGNSNGYFQFQWAAQGLRVGLTYQDENFETITPFQILINNNGSIVSNDGFNLPVGYASPGDYFRIRHFAADNTVHFQRRTEIYQVLNNTTSIVGDLRRVTTTWSNVILSEILEIQKFFDDGAVKFKKADGSFIFGNSSQYQNNTEAVVSIGQDYVTFHTHSNFTNGNNLYFDTSLYAIGSQINDVLIAK